MKDEWKYPRNSRFLTVVATILLGLMFVLDAIGLSRIADAIFGGDDMGQV